MNNEQKLENALNDARIQLVNDINKLLDNYSIWAITTSNDGANCIQCMPGRDNNDFTIIKLRDYPNFITASINDIGVRTYYNWSNIAIDREKFCKVYAMLEQTAEFDLIIRAVDAIASM